MQWKRGKNQTISLGASRRKVLFPLHLPLIYHSGSLPEWRGLFIALRCGCVRPGVVTTQGTRVGPDLPVSAPSKRLGVAKESEMFVNISYVGVFVENDGEYRKRIESSGNFS